ncbi:UNVERIFIED_CONTAM: hypothetical protein GTU68_042193, partial [Idotea baltica]|nr:hypothetical protein [Idotea baltica]
AAVALKPQQQVNKKLDIQQNILRAAGLLPEDSNQSADGKSVDELFSQFQVLAVELDTGKVLADYPIDGYDPIKAAREPSLSRDLNGDEDVAVLGRRENVSLVYLLVDDKGDTQTVVIPVRGYGLWGTLYGYLALAGDARSTLGLGFYDQKETPGLGGEVVNPKWKAQWDGVRLYDDAGVPAVSLVKSRAPSGSAKAAYEVDALSGATLTTRGVENLVNFWTGELGFGPYLNKLRASS